MKKSKKLFYILKRRQPATATLYRPLYTSDMRPVFTSDMRQVFVRGVEHEHR